MKHREPPRAATLAAVLARALPDARPSAIAFAVGSMIHAAKAHQRWGEQTCNYPMTEVQTARGDKRCARLATIAVGDLRLLIDHAKGGGCDDPEDGIAARIKLIGNSIVRTVRLEFGGDCRGPCGMLHISDMPGDGFGPGWAIYS